MNKISNVPQIRFKGFTDAWEQRKLGELVQFVNGRAYKQEELLDVGKYKVVRVGNFNTNEKWYFSDLELETDKYMDNGDLLYLWATSFGPVIWQEEKAIFHYHIWKLKNFESLDKKYLYSFLEWDKKKISQNTNGSTMVHITKNMIEQRDIEYPTKSEQYRIGSLLESVDNLITLHQRKYNQVVNFKKAMLEKMFPKDGRYIPEIRFKEFNKKDINAWEKKNFGDMVDFFSGLTYTPNDVKKEGTLVLRSSNVKNGEIVSADNVFVNSKVVNSKNVEFGDVIVVVRNGSRDLIGKRAQIKKDMPNTVIGAFMTGIRSERPDFISAILDTDKFDKEISKNMGATINQITGKMFMEMNFVIPSEEEQIKIGAFFRKLDDLILLYYQKLQKLKHIKKALLEKMFV